MRKEILPQSPYAAYSNTPTKRRFTDRIRGALFDGMVTVDLTFCSFLAYGLDRGNPVIPDFLQGRVVDTIGIAATAAFLKTIYKIWDPAPDLKEYVKGTKFENIGNKLIDKRPLLAAFGAFIGQANYEIMQGLGIMPGTYDPGDFIAYGIGTLGFVGLNYGAKYLENRFAGSILENTNKLSIITRQILPGNKL